MAVKGYVDQLLNGISQELRYPLQQAFHYVMDGWRLGTGAKAENALWYRVHGTTAATANTEFAIVHGLSQAPSQLLPILDLTQIGSQVVPLVVSRAPDAERLYLKSSSTSAAITLMVEP